jgi:hypothetical protein
MANRGNKIPTSQNRKFLFNPYKEESAAGGSVQHCSFVLFFRSSMLFFSYPKSMVFVKKHYVKYIVIKIAYNTLFTLNVH